MSCTLVTAFYDIHSKFKKEQYIEWAKTLLLIDAPIVLFTDPYLVAEIQFLRGQKPIHIVPIPFDELDVWILYKDKWITQHIHDPEKARHTPELYAIWAQKAFFVERAILANPFDTEYFMWCDFGAFRDTNIDTRILQTFPHPAHFKDDKLLLQAVKELSESDIYVRDDGIRGEKITDSWNDIRLVGGLWGGSITACKRWKMHYQIMLERYFKSGRFAGKDQAVMLSTYLETPELATVVKCTCANIDPWFFLQHLLSDSGALYALDTTYSLSDRIMNTTEMSNRPIVSVSIKGGLGNQMFQVATAYAYTKQHGGRLQIMRNKRESDGRPLYWDSVLHRFDKYLVNDIPATLVKWNEHGATEYSSIPPLTESGIYLDGYLQSPLYFGDEAMNGEIRELFSPTESMLSRVTAQYQTLLDNKDRVVVVHARRTDYLRNQDIINFHGPLTKEYYKETIKRMCQHVINPIFLLSADDPMFWIEIMKDVPEFEEFMVYILNDINEVDTLTLLQQFRYYVIANSTFSWWACWMSTDAKIVIAPSKWFGPTGPKNYKDIYMPSWILV